MPTTLPSSDNVEHWQTAGPHALALCRPSITRRNVITDYLGFILPDDEQKPGEFRFWLVDCHFPLTGLFFQATVGRSVSLNQSWASTQSGQCVPDAIPNATRQHFNLYNSVTGANGEVFTLNSFILVSRTELPDSLPLIGQLIEVLQVTSSAAVQWGGADHVLLEEFIIVGSDARYRLPRLQSHGWCLMNAEVKSHSHFTIDFSLISILSLLYVASMFNITVLLVTVTTKVLIQFIKSRKPQITPVLAFGILFRTIWF